MVRKCIPSNILKEYFIYKLKDNDVYFAINKNDEDKIESLRIKYHGHQNIPESNTVDCFKLSFNEENIGAINDGAIKFPLCQLEYVFIKYEEEKKEEIIYIPCINI